MRLWVSLRLPPPPSSRDPLQRVSLASGSFTAEKVGQPEDETLSSVWIGIWGFLPTKLRYFVASSVELLTAHTHPYATLEDFLICCYTVNVLLLDDSNGSML